MANWQRTLNLADVWHKTKDNGEPDVISIAKVAADRLAALAPFNDPSLDDEKEEIVQELRELAEDPEGADVAWFDQIYSRLCDWGDTSLDGKWNGRKVCWIATF